MTNEAIWQVCVTTTAEAEDAVVDLLGRLFGQPASAYANEETKISSVSVYCTSREEWNPEQKSAVAAGLELIRASGLETAPAKVSVRRVARQDWSESWKRHFKALEISSRLLIKPSWSRRRVKSGQAEVVLDPGLSFGTGNHPTTAFCLHEVAAFRQAGVAQSFWDVGTGSGILAIAASKLGYRPVRALDFDPEAVRVALQNAADNAVSDQIQIRRADITKIPPDSKLKYDLICANLISNLLLAEQRRLLSRMKPGGRIVLAGILKREFSEIQQAYEQAGLKFLRGRTEREWRSGTFVLPI